MTLKEIKYTTSVATIFAGVGFTLLLFFLNDEKYLANNYVVMLIFIAFILAFPYFLLKFFFYINSHNKNEELKLEDLPKDQDDIEHSH